MDNFVLLGRHFLQDAFKSCSTLCLRGVMMRPGLISIHYLKNQIISSSIYDKNVNELLPIECGECQSRDLEKLYGNSDSHLKCFLIQGTRNLHMHDLKYMRSRTASIVSSVVIVLGQSLCFLIHIFMPLQKLFLPKLNYLNTYISSINDVKHNIFHQFTMNISVLFLQSKIEIKGCNIKC